MNVVGTRNVVALGVPVVYYSTDYVFDGRKGEPYVESDEPDPLGVYAKTKLAGEREIRDGWIVRSSWLFGGPGATSSARCSSSGRERDEVSVVDDQVGCPTYVGHLAAATRELLELPKGDLARRCRRRVHVGRVRPRRSSRKPGSTAACARITTEELGRPAPRPAYSVLRSEREGAPRLPALARRPASLPRAPRVS